METSIIWKTAGGKLRKSDENEIGKVFDKMLLDALNVMEKYNDVCKFTFYFSPPKDCKEISAYVIYFDETHNLELSVNSVYISDSLIEEFKEIGWDFHIASASDDNGKIHMTFRRKF